MTGLLNKIKILSLMLNFGIVITLCLTLFIDKWFVLLLLPFPYYYGAIKRGLNQIPHFERVKGMGTKITLTDVLQKRYQ